MGYKRDLRGSEDDSINCSHEEDDNTSIYMCYIYVCTTRTYYVEWLGL